MIRKTLSEIYHQETKYEETKMARHQRQLDWAAQPSPYKEYHSDKKIDLTPYLPFQNHIFTGEPMVASPKDGEGHPFGKGAISRLLYFTNGVTGIMQYPTGQSLCLRAAPTAGGLYPTETYLATRGLSGLSDGIYNFHVSDHTLVPVWEGNFWNEFERYCVYHEAIGQSQLLVVLTAVYQRSAWRYQERAYRRILLDTGHVLGNLTAYALEEGFVPYPIGGFFDSELNRLLFLNESDEGVLAVIPLLQAAKINPEEIRHVSTMASSYKTSKTFKEEDPLQLKLHRVSSIFSGEKVDPEGGPSTLALPERIGRIETRYRHKEAIPLPSAPIDLKERIGQTIVRRRSTRAFSGEALLVDEMASILEYAYRPLLSRPLPFFDPALLETYLLIQNVADIGQGVYYYSALKNEVRLLSAGDFKEQAWHFCLGQDLAKDAALLVIHIANLKEAIDSYGDRAYRYLHLDAGHIGERMNLAAIHLGLGVSGIGGFYDDEVNALIGLSLDQIVVYITTLGRPQNESR